MVLTPLCARLFIFIISHPDQLRLFLQQKNFKHVLIFLFIVIPRTILPNIKFLSFFDVLNWHIDQAIGDGHLVFGVHFAFIVLEALIGQNGIPVDKIGYRNAMTVSL